MAILVGNNGKKTIFHGYDGRKAVLEGDDFEEEGSINERRGKCM